MILYIIQAHRDIPQIVALVRQISDEKNFCVVNLDPHLQSERSNLEHQLASLGRGDIRVRIGAPVNWGGISQVYALLDALAFAATVEGNWEFVINLSADSIALAPQQEIYGFYAAAKQNGQRIHIGYFGTSAVVDEFLMLPPASKNFELEMKAINLYRKIPALVSQEIEPIFQSRASSPLFRWKVRGSIHVNDLFPERKLIIRPLLFIEERHRRTSFRNRPLWGGRAWFTLERGTVERMLSDVVLAEVTQLLEHFFCPDELFLQTYLARTTRFRMEEVDRQNQRFRNGNRENIHDGMLDELISSGAFFARKITFANCPLILRRLNGAMGDGFS